MKASFEFTAGRLLCGRVRDFLNSCKLKGMDIDFAEGSGFIQRDFTIAGKPEDVEIVRRSLINWSNQLD